MNFFKKITDLAVYSLVVLIPFQVYLPIYQDKHLTVFLMLLLVVFLIKFCQIERIAFGLSEKIYLLLLLFILIRGLFGNDKLELLKYLLFLGSGQMIYAVILTSEIDTKKLIRTIIFATLPMVLLMTWVYFHEKTEWIILKQPVMKLFIEPDTLRQAINAPWEQNIYLEHRVGGFFVNSNIAGLFLGLALTLTSGEILFKETFKTKIIWLAIALLFLSSIIFTGSVGASVALVISFLVGIILYPGRLRKKFAGHLLTSLLLMIILSYAVIKLNPRMEQTSENSDFHGRSLIWKVSWQVIKENWLLGTGLSNYEWNKEYNPVAEKIGAPPNMPPHNMFLTVWGKTGIIGAGLLLIFFLVKLKNSAWRFYNSGNYHSLIVFVATLWFVIQAMVENFPLMDLRIVNIYWFLLALEKKCEK